MIDPLKSKLYNDATVADWLGTARLHALSGAQRLNNIRDELSTPSAELPLVVRDLEDALEEVRTIQAHLATLQA